MLFLMTTFAVNSCSVNNFMIYGITAVNLFSLIELVKNKRVRKI
jgi:hypothetical protein